MSRKVESGCANAPSVDVEMAHEFYANNPDYVSSELRGSEDCRMEGARAKLTDVNPHLVCVLCHGYFIDATTIAECLHSFCRSCIFRHLERKPICPICEVPVHNTKLHRSLRPDKTLQDIVYKLVPGLYRNEMQRRREFYKQHPFRDEYLEPECRGVGLDRVIYSPDDLISLSLEFYDEDREKEEWNNNNVIQKPVPIKKPSPGSKRYLQCPAGFKMMHLKKFIRQKCGLPENCEVEVIYRKESLPDSYSLMDIAYIYTWKRNEPMRFYYKLSDAHVKTLEITKALASRKIVKEIEENLENSKKDAVQKPIEPSLSPILIEEKPHSDHKVDVEIKSMDKKGESKVEALKSSDGAGTINQSQLSDSEVKKPGYVNISVEAPVGTSDNVKTPSGMVVVTSESQNKFSEIGAISSEPWKGLSKVAAVTNESQKDPSTMLVPPVSVSTELADRTNNESVPPRTMTKQDELPVSVLLSLGNCTPDMKRSLPIEKTTPRMEPKFILPKPVDKNSPSAIDKMPSKKMPGSKTNSKKVSVNKIASDLADSKTSNNHVFKTPPPKPQLAPFSQNPLMLKLHSLGSAPKLADPAAGNRTPFHQSQVHPSPGNRTPFPHSHVDPAPGNRTPFPHSRVDCAPGNRTPFPHSQVDLALGSRTPYRQADSPTGNKTPLHEPFDSPASCRTPFPSSEMPQHLPVYPPPLLPSFNKAVPWKDTSKDHGRLSLFPQSPRHIPQYPSMSPKESKPSPQPADDTKPSQDPFLFQSSESEPSKNESNGKALPNGTLNASSKSSSLPSTPLPKIVNSNQDVNTAAPPINQNGLVTHKPDRPEVTVKTSNGSLTISTQLPKPTIKSNNELCDDQNGKATPPHQVLQKNLSGQRLNGNGLITSIPTNKTKSRQESKLKSILENKSGNSESPNVSGVGPGNKNLSLSRKKHLSGGVMIPGGVVSRTGPTLDQRLQQLYKSNSRQQANGQSPSQKTQPVMSGKQPQSRLASWLNSRFNAQSKALSPPNDKVDEVSEDNEKASHESATAKLGKEMSMLKKKLDELRKNTEGCEITQENPTPDTAKKVRDVTPNVSIELMKAADMKKLEVVNNTKGKDKGMKRPVPGLKAIQDVDVKKMKMSPEEEDAKKPKADKKGEEAALDLSGAGKPSDELANRIALLQKNGALNNQKQFNWLLNRPLIAGQQYLPRST